MSLPGEEKEIRMQPSSLAYNNNNNNNHPLDSPVATPPEISPPDLFSGGGSKPRPAASYRECLKNHAAGIGRNVTDGCGEFMPSGDNGTLEALKCAACGCHRNFHRKDSSAAAAAGEHLPPPPSAAMVHPLQLPPPLPSPAAAAAAALWSPMAQPVKMAFAAGGGGGGGGSIGTDSSSEELNYNPYGGAVAPPPPPFTAKKRFRTKFTSGQKERMLEFAEKLGWRIPREDDTEVQRFCSEVGVKRQVFKVWMHNNKSASKKPPEQQQQQQEQQQQQQQILRG
ncbi:homeobox protein 31 [Striga asiatica]|uniref:Homeobox protein 31 n=1 Tax=Striga asiatica TaxID=4170 RepID=A0A5A7PBR1_STRAF|nr:homeobox protein 31 [Striga asiatica]